MAPVPAAVPGYSFEFGARYWYSSGKLAKDLYDDPRFTTDIVSRLTYDGLTAHSFEAFGKIALPNNLFVKGYAGISGLSQGKPERRGLPAADHSLFQHDEQPERRAARLHDRRSRLRLRRQSGDQRVAVRRLRLCRREGECLRLQSGRQQSVHLRADDRRERARHHRGRALARRAARRRRRVQADREADALDGSRLAPGRAASLARHALAAARLDLRQLLGPDPAKPRPAPASSSRRCSPTRCGIASASVSAAATGASMRAAAPISNR